MIDLLCLSCDTILRLRHISTLDTTVNGLQKSTFTARAKVRADVDIDNPLTGFKGLNPEPGAFIKNFVKTKGILLSIAAMSTGVSASPGRF
jgi:hypothetical protein